MIIMYAEREMCFKFTFDNGAIYECSTQRDDCVVTEYSIKETESVNVGNPLGIISSNTLQLSIFDDSGVLARTNTSSPYYGYMRNGVKIEVFEKYKDSLDTERTVSFGVYYTDSWQNSNNGGDLSTVNISAVDKLTYVGKLPIPELDDYGGVTVVDLYYNLLKKCGAGLTDNDIYADPSLELSMSFTIMKGDRMMSVLNSIAQALIARITISRDGKIMLLPAFPKAEPEETLDAEVFSSINFSQNQDNNYNKVQLKYNLVSDRASEELARYEGLVLKPGENTINDLSLTSDAVGLDGVYIEYTSTPEKYLGMIEYIAYQGYQSGVTVRIKNNTSENISCNIAVWGTSTALSDATVERELPYIGGVTTSNVADTLMLESYIIQTEEDANKYLDDVVNYITKTSHEVSVSGMLPTYFKAGMYITITDDSKVSRDDITGTFYIKGVTLDFNMTTMVTLNMYKVEG